MNDSDFGMIDDIIRAAQSLEAGHEWGIGSAEAERHLKDCVHKLANEFDALRARIAELEAAAAWIPVGERLPEKTGRYEVLTFWLEVAIGDFVLGG